MIQTIKERVIIQPGGKIEIVHPELRTAPVSLRDNGVIMRLPSSRIIVALRKEGCHDSVPPYAGRRAAQSLGPTVCPVAAEPHHTPWPHPSPPVGAGGRPQSGVAPRPCRQTTGPHTPYLETACWRPVRSRAHFAVALFALRGSDGSGLAHAHRRGRGPAGRRHPVANHV